MKRPRLPPLLAALGVGLALGGCETPGPRPAPPALLEATALAGASSEAAVPAIDARWWRDFGDSQLDGLVDEALAASPTLEVARARVRAAQASEESVGTPYQPRLDAAVGATAGHVSLGGTYPPAFGGGNLTDFNAGLKLSWDLDLWGRKRSAADAAALRARAAELELSDARLLLASNLVGAYLELDRAYRVLDTERASRESRAAVLNLTLDRRRAGLDTDLEVETARGGVAAADGDIAAAEEQIGLLHNQIAALVGAGPARGQVLERPALKPAPALSNLNELPASLVARRADVAANRLIAEAAAKDVAVARTAFYPNINLAAMARLDRVNLPGLFDGTSRFASVAPAITLPLYGQPELRGNLHAADAAYQQAVAGYNGSVIVAFQQVADAVESLRELDAQEQAARASVASLKRAFELATLRYRSGLTDYLSVLVAQDRLLAEQRRVVDVESRRATLTVNLIRALGGGFAA